MWSRFDETYLGTGAGLVQARRRAAIKTHAAKEKTHHEQYSRRRKKSMFKTARTTIQLKIIPLGKHLANGVVTGGNK